MTSRNGLSLYIVGPLPPDSQRATLRSVESVQRSACRPQMQHRARDTLGCFVIRLVMLDIETRGRALFLAYCVDPGRIAIRFEVLRFHLWAERAATKRVVEHRVRGSQEIFFWKRRFL